MAVLTAVIYRLGRHSIAARWYDTGRLSPISLLMMYQSIQNLVELTALGIVESADNIITKAIIAS